MKTSKRDTKYLDKHRNSIFEGDLCRSTIKGGMFDEREETLFERVSHYKGNWVLMEVDYDYENRDDEPVLLKDFCHRVEVVTNSQ